MYFKDYFIGLSYPLILKTDLSLSLPKSVEINIKNAWTTVGDFLRTKNRFDTRPNLPGRSKRGEGGAQRVPIARAF